VRSTYDNDEVTLVPGFVRGFRSWMLDKDFPLLRSVSRPYVWQPGQNEASCALANCDCWHCRPRADKRLPHAAPSLKCSCGFYARHLDWRHGYSGIEGIIRASGNIILGTGGFRAQIAEVEALVASSGWLYNFLEITKSEDLTHHQPKWAVDKSTESVQLLLAREYRVPLFNTYEEAQEAFPFPDVSELLKEKPCPQANTPTIL
jgi:hypothetical protein